MKLSKPSVDRGALSDYLACLLDINRIRDFSPNGLQVEGRDCIASIVTGVTASAALIEAALEEGADAILVHHGYFWRGEDGRITGIRRQRLKRLLAHDINLFAYHLPLDVHPELGNNARLGRQLGLSMQSQFGENNLGWLGRPDDPAVRTVGDLARLVEQRLARAPMVIGDPQQSLGLVGWCTGAAQGYLDDAIAAGAGAYLSGEISEQTVHLARETGVAYLACGHHATERYGIQALGEHLAGQFGIAHRFIDIDNPV